VTPRRAQPNLLLIAEHRDTDLDELERIAALTPHVWTVLAVLAGSTTVRVRGRTPVDIRVLPISPLELDRFTAHVDWRTSTPQTRDTVPMALYVQDSRSVLVVDDNLINQVVVRGQLEALGYDVMVAGDGVEALDTCRAHPPDMVLMDIDMPVMNDLAATEHIRSSQRAGVLPPFPIVAATSGAAQREECLRAGMDGYLCKPMDLDTLADEMRRLLPTRPVAAEGW
jgi:CheY-like chemotaxis protein